MGTFVLGILVGWLAEWLFFTFWVKNNSKSDSSDCSELSAQLKTKNNEIESLKASLSKAENRKVEPVVSSASTTASSTKTLAEKTSSPKKSTTDKTKVAVKNPVTKKVTPKKAVEKAPAKKVTKTKKSVPAAKKEKTAIKKKAPSKKTLGDDLTKLSGIGPSMAATMAEIGITSFKKLAAMDDDILRDMLEASGARLNNNKEAMDSWNEQATLADKGDFDGLKKLQEELKK